MGFNDPVLMDEKVADPGTSLLQSNPALGTRGNWYVYLAVLLIAGIVYLSGILSPPSLMDDVDAVQAQIARNMLTSGDWVTARLDGVAYLEKAPLVYWMMAVSYELFGVHDWAARLPIALFIDRALLVDCRFWGLGIRQTRRFLRWPLHGDLHRAVSLYSHFDSRRNSDIHDCPGNVGVVTSPRRRGGASARLGLCSGRQSGNRTASEKPDRGAVPGSCRGHLSDLDAVTYFPPGPGGGFIRLVG